MFLKEEPWLASDCGRPTSLLCKNILLHFEVHHYKMSVKCSHIHVLFCHLLCLLEFHYSFNFKHTLAVAYSVCGLSPP